jgi:dolichol-phosphate mannosyltransferase
MQSSDIINVLVLAAFKENDNLRELLPQLAIALPDHTAIIVADDSPMEFRKELYDLTSQTSSRYGVAIHLSLGDEKSGRGSAVRRSFELARDLFPRADYFLEADSDGSHAPDDILRVLVHASAADLLIGSRYLPHSTIIGWSRSRRIMSSSLNFLIPKLLSLPCSDVTNGLRRYSRAAVAQILGAEADTAGFIYLAEVALLLHRAGFNIEELPIAFDERRHGSSSVGFSELAKSLVGLVQIIGSQSKN